MSRPSLPVRALLAAVGPALVLAGCGSSAGGGSAGRLTVLAAASLTGAFTAERAAFLRDHPGTRIDLSFGGSQQLVAQVEQGAPADLVATADEAQLHRLAAAGRLAGPARDFASNRLEIAVAAGNPRQVRGLADLAARGLVVVLAAPQVPAGAYAQQALRGGGVSVHPASLEEDVKGVVTKVELGEADAGIVYATDVTAARGKVTGVPLPAARNVVAHYPLAAVRGGDTELAGRFADFVLSAAGQRILHRYGFGPP